MKQDGFERANAHPELDLSEQLPSVDNLKFLLPRSIDNPLFRPNQAQEGDKPISNLGEHIDVEWSVKMMDLLWNASLYDFMKAQENAECIARYISPIIQDYDIPQIVQGLNWLLDGWKPESKARFLRIIFADYTPSYSGRLFARLAVDWEFETDVTMNCALILIKEPASLASLFIAELSRDWSAVKIVELVGCLDVILDWSELYFQEFTLSVIERVCTIDTNDNSSTLLEQLTLMYEMNLAQTNLKLAMADYELGLTEHKLKNLSVVLKKGKSLE